MSENSKIEWCDHTFNPWIGCTKVSPGCANCYAANSTRARVLRAGGHETWGKGAPRSRTKTWGDPVKWNRDAEGAEHRPRVFCASLADWLDDEVPIDWLADLLDLIRRTPNLDWLLLTKRPENFFERINGAFMHLAKTGTIAQQATVNWLADWMGTLHCEIPGEPPSPPENVLIGTTVENQEMADKRLPQLLSIPATVRFLSCEPLLGPVDLMLNRNGHTLQRSIAQELHWVIAGGESGPKARPMHPDWARSLRDQCQDSNVPFLFKQWGEWAPVEQCTQVQYDNAILGEFHGGKDFIVGCGCSEGDRTGDMRRIGKKAAGRLLDGREWNEFPTTSLP